MPNNNYIVNVALGDKVPSAMYLGDDQVEAMYLGDTLIFPITATGITVVTDVLTDESDIQVGDTCLFYCPGHDRYVSDRRSRTQTLYYYYSTFFPESYTHQGVGYVSFDTWEQGEPLIGIVSAVSTYNTEKYVSFYTPGSYSDSGTVRFGPDIASPVNFSGTFRIMPNGSLRVTAGALVGKLKDSQTIQFGNETDNMSDDDYNFKYIKLRKVLTTT